jgi:hypothetical protein
MIAKIGKEAAEETVNAAMFQIGLGKAIHFFISVLSDSPCKSERAYGLNSEQCASALVLNY